MVIKTTAVRFVEYSRDGYQNRYMTIPTLVWSDEDVDRHITKHYVAKPGETEITSYSDLQRFSSQIGAIGHEKPFFHIREDIELGLDPLVPYPEPVLPTPAPYTDYRGSSRYLYLVAEADGKYYTSASVSLYWYSPYTVQVKSINWTCVEALPLRDDSQYWYCDSRSAGLSTGTQMVYIPEDHDRYDYIALGDILLQNIDGMLLSLHNLLPGKNVGTQALKKSSGPKWVYWNVPYYEANLAPDVFDPWNDYILYRDNHHEPASLYSHLVGEALKNTTVDTNSIANGLELFDLASDIKSGRIIEDILGKSKLFEKSKNAWLAYRYSYSTTKSDISSLGDYIAQRSKTIARSGDRRNDGEMHVKISISPPESQINKLASQLTEYGVAPNLYNIWDLMPYSFVVDWFLGIGDLLEDITAYGRCAAYKINYVTHSWKWVEEFERSGSKCKLTFYERSVSPTAPPYVPYVEKSVSDKTILMRCMDAVALFT